MKFVSNLLSLIDGYKTYSAAILTAATGVGMILTRDYQHGIPEVFQALTMLFGTATAAGLKGTLDQLHAAVRTVPTGYGISTVATAAGLKGQVSTR